MSIHKRLAHTDEQRHGRRRSVCVYKQKEKSYCNYFIYTYSLRAYIFCGTNRKIKRKNIYFHFSLSAHHLMAVCKLTHGDMWWACVIWKIYKLLQKYIIKIYNI